MSDDDDPTEDPRSGPPPLTAMAAIGWSIGAMFLFFLFGLTLAAIRPSSANDVVSSVGCQAMGYLVALFLILRVHAPEAGVRDFVGMRPTQPLFYPLAIALGLSLELPANALYTIIERRFPTQIEDHITAAFQDASNPRRVAIALAVILFGPMLEEVLFRGALFRPMLKVHPAPMVIGVTAALFAMAHLTPQSWIPIGLLGLTLGFIRRESGSLVPSMLVHATFNAVPFYAMAAHPGAKGDDGPISVPLVAASAAAALVILGLVRLLGRRAQAARIAQEFDLL